VQSAPTNNGHHWGTDPEINFGSIRQNNPSQHPADNSLHAPAQQDDDGSSAATDGSHQGRGQVDASESASPKFADVGSAYSAHTADEDTSVQSAPANKGHHWGTDPEINFASIRQNNPSQHPADNSLHAPVQQDDNASPAATDGAHPGRGQVDGIVSVSPKFAEDGNAHHGAVPYHPATPTALSNDLSGDDSTQSFNTTIEHHASADPEMNEVTNNPLQHTDETSLHTPTLHDDNGSPAVTDGAHPADQVDRKQFDSFKFAADNDSGHAESGPDGAHTTDPQVDQNRLNFVNDRTHPDTAPDGVHTAHPQVDGHPLDSFKFADNDSAHPGRVVPHESPTLTALVSDSSGTHGSAAPNLNVPGNVMSDAASDTFIFGKGSSHEIIGDQEPDITSIDHAVSADIQHLLDTAHDANAVSTLEANHAIAPQDMTKLPQHQGDFHFA
jgi:hypothetical protein